MPYGGPAILSLSAHAIAFSPSSALLCAASLDGDLNIISLKDAEPSILHTFSHTRATIRTIPFPSLFEP